MIKKILMDCSIDEVRIALLEDSELKEIIIEDKRDKTIVGNIYIGRISNILPSIGAAFVDIGIEKNAFMYIGENKEKYYDILESHEASPYSKNKHRIGDDVLVQIEKEASGSKGCVATRDLSFPGRNLVLMYGKRHIGMSKKIQSPEERERLKKIALDICPDDYGLIVRTSGEGKSLEELSAELKGLLEQSRAVVEKSQYLKSPCLLKQELSAVEKAVRDLLSEDITELIVDNKDIFDLVCRLAGDISDTLAQKIKLYTGSMPLFDSYFVESQIEAALQKKVWLKSGGFLIIEQTEACVVIDVNTGKFSGKSSIADTILKTNTEAAIEIAKQIRLRNLSGMLIIDFIDMTTQEQKDIVKRTFEEEFKRDRIKTVVVGMTELGLMQVTRKKVNKPLSKYLCSVCPCCQGKGSTESVAFVARRIKNKIEYIFGQTIYSAVQLTAKQSVLNEFETYIPHLEKKYDKSIYLAEADIASYDIKKIN